VPKFRRATPPNSEIKELLYYILSQFLTLFEKKCKAAFVPGKGCASKTWSFSSACKNLGAQHPLGPEICSSEICALSGYLCEAA